MRSKKSLILLGIPLLILLVVSNQNCADSQLQLPEIEEEPLVEAEATTLSIIDQPQSPGRFLFGSDVTLSIQADSNAPISYQWFKDNTEIPGANSESLELLSANDEDAGEYFVRVTADTETLDSEIASVDPVDPATPLTAVGPIRAPGGIVSNITGALQAGQNMGLARDGSVDFLTFNGQNVTACGHYSTNQMIMGKIDLVYQVTRTPIGGDSCVGALCNTAPGLVVFTSTDGINWILRVLVAGMGMVSPPNPLPLSVSVPQPFQNLIVCRTAASGDRDNLFIRDLKVTKEALL